MCLGDSFREVLAKVSAGDESLCESVCVGGIAVARRGVDIFACLACVRLCVPTRTCAG